MSVLIVCFFVLSVGVSVCRSKIPGLLFGRSLTRLALLDVKIGFLMEFLIVSDLSGFIWRSPSVFPDFRSKLSDVSVLIVGFVRSICRFFGLSV